MGSSVETPAFYSLLRWRSDPTRDEARNVAVVLAGDGDIGGFRAAPVSSISKRLHEQGIVDAVLQEFEKRFSGPVKPTVAQIDELRGSMVHSLYFTPPTPTAVGDPEQTLTALYRALVAPHGGGSRVLTKGKVLDGVVATLRKSGSTVHRGQYIDDFIFDAIVERATKPVVVEALSFATSAKNWVPAEQAAAHFLYGLERVDRPGIAVLQPPTEMSHANARAAFSRVKRWFSAADCPISEPAKIADVLASLG